MTTTNTINSTVNTATTCGGYASLADAIANLGACVNSHIAPHIKQDTCTNSNIAQNIINTTTTIDTGRSNTIWASDTYTIQPSQFVSSNVITKDNLYEELEKYNQKKEDKTNMKNIFDDIGPITDGTIALSIKGMAVKNPSGKYVAYDEEKEEMYDVDIMHFDVKTPLFYRIPVALNDICMGDIIIHNKHYCYVVDGDGKQFTVIDINMSEQRIVLPQKSPFGFNYVIKVISLIKPGEASGETPFGNMIPFMLMSDDTDNQNILPFLLMSNSSSDLTKNPMLMYFLLKDHGNNNDILPLILMGGGKFSF